MPDDGNVQWEQKFNDESWEELQVTDKQFTLSSKNAPGTYTFRARVHGASTWKTIENPVTIINVDLDIDADYDGNIDDDDEEKEESAGGLAGVNHDDDNQNEKPDKDETGKVTGEDDLIPIKITLQPDLKDGTLTLEAISGNDKIKIWEEETKTKECPGTWTIGQDDIKETYYVEGIDASASMRDVELCLQYTKNNENIDDKVKLTVLLIKLVEMKESGNFMNIIPNDYKFPEKEVENKDSDVAYVKKYDDYGWDSVKINRSQLILIAGVSPTIETKWDVENIDSSFLMANMTYGKYSEIGRNNLDRSGKAYFNLPTNYDDHYKAWNAFIDQPHILNANTIGKVILISKARWEIAKIQLSIYAQGGDFIGLDAASSMLLYFINEGSQAPYQAHNNGYKRIVKDDIWYNWLTHKVGLKWNGNSSSLFVRRWDATSGFANDIKQSFEYLQVIEKTIDDNFTSLKNLPEGASSTYSINNRIIEYRKESDGGSSDNLYYSVAKARLSGTIVITVGEKNSHNHKLNIDNIIIDIVLEDLIDFNYFNTPGNVGALMQAGWNKYNGIDGGAGNVYFLQVYCPHIIHGYIHEK